jgi:hypothetical protein
MLSVFLILSLFCNSFRYFSLADDLYPFSAILQQFVPGLVPNQLVHPLVRAKECFLCFDGCLLTALEDTGSCRSAGTSWERGS